MPPDFNHARRELRRARVSAALGVLLSSELVAANRDRLVQLLAAESVNDDVVFDHLSDNQVETVVSIAVAAVEESGGDAAAVLLMSLRVLAADGQFARLALLADRLVAVARRFELQRPYWALSLTAFSEAIRGRRKSSETMLAERLGVGRDAVNQESLPRIAQHVDDIIAATALKSLLAEPNDAEFATQARHRAVIHGEGLQLVYLDAVLTWSAAVSAAAPRTVLQRADPIFREKQLSRYMSRLPVQALFPAQIGAIEGGATNDQSRVVALPTSSGKTLIAELRIVATLQRHPGSRAIYVAPYRLLSRQVERQLRPGLRAAGYDIRDLGTGYDPSALRQEDVVPVIVCTPERLDGLMRLASSSAEGSAEAAAFLDSVSVLVFDELHLIGRSGRGPRFELILARLRMRSPELRVLGLAAATHGSQELSEWLGDEPRVPRSSRPTGTLELVWETNGAIKQRSSRTSPSTVMSLPRKQAIDDAAALLLRLTGEHLPALAICISRQRAEGLAKKVLSGSAVKGEQWRSSLPADSWLTVQEAIEEVRALLGDAHPLAQMMESGVAFHHAGVPAHALEQIERLARAGLLRVVCATTTVAEGADLPFRAVVIPHLNFPGASRRLERDLYLNIIGRAGRANVAVEGMVFILDSDSPTLNNVVRSSLWSTSARDVLRGKLSQVLQQPTTVEEWNDLAEVQSQVLAWLADTKSSYVDNQAMALCHQSFTFDQGNNFDKQTILSLIQGVLTNLETNGYAVAGSPLRVTERGAVAQLTGLSLPGVFRISAAVERGRTGWLNQLAGLAEITPVIANLVSRLLFEAPEVIQNSLWFRRNAKDRMAWPTLERFAYHSDASHLKSSDYELDIEILTAWLLGNSYADLASTADVAAHSNSLFGGQDPSKRVSDATEYVGKLVYPAGWVWSGAQILAGDLGATFPAFIRGAIEYGVPSETAVRLIERGRLTRPAAMTISRVAGSSWDGTVAWLLADQNVDELATHLTRADAERLRQLRDLVEQESTESVEPDAASKAF